MLVARGKGDGHRSARARFTTLLVGSAPAQPRSTPQPNTSRSSCRSTRSSPRPLHGLLIGAIAGLYPRSKPPDSAPPKHSAPNDRPCQTSATGHREHMISLLTILIGVLALALIVAGIAAAIAPPRPKRTASVKAAYGRQAERRIRDQLYDTRADLTHHHPRPGPTATIQKRVERPARPPNASPSTRSALARLRTLQAPLQRQLRAGANATELAGKRPPGRRDRCRRDPAASLDPRWKRSIARGESPAPLP
jgi:hypothetical protein